MRRWRRIGTSILAGLVSVTSSQAIRAQGGEEELTLPRAVEIALQRNPLARMAIAGREIADAQIAEARAARFPIVQFSETFSNGNNPVFVFGSLLEQARFGPANFDLRFLNHPPSLNVFRTALTLRVPLFDRWQTETRHAQAEEEVRRADAQAAWIEQQIRFEVIRAYYNVLSAEARQRVADEAVRMAEADVQRIRAMFEAGLVVISDVLAAEVQLAEFRQQLIQADGDVVTARAGLNTALGLPVTAPHRVVGQLIERTFEVEGPEELMRLALQHRPDLVRARLAVRSREHGVRGALGQYLPRLDLFATVGATGRGLLSGSADYTIGASLTFEVFDGGRAARVRQARAALALTEAETEQLVNQIRLDVVRAFEHYRSARERLVVAARAVQQAEEALRIVQDRHQEGLTTITEVLRAQTALVRARMNALTARYEYVVGYATVLLATGRLTDIRPFI
ncbi:MAG: TolC family protein [Blastocatellia bacterium]|nr:TolC family protein [Blastocatellia bacterium]MCS7158011.1 TolC family protein [Blastocatellia bacterium]MCX7752518.1 TolC family protein [Blastocatellia bacterium]MDW8167367.1 TolC family protein [Acidobacteriota bacterium]MDW8257308.1 TolC family protein [Acidobacteriota bacterium]